MDLFPEKLNPAREADLAFWRGVVAHYGANYLAWRRSDYEWYASHFGDLYDVRGLDGLDLGCGAVRAASWLIGIDRRPGVWQDASGGRHESFPLVVGDALALPPQFRPGAIDLIVSNHLLEHFTEPTSALAYWASLLRPGGRLAIVVPDYRHTFSCTQPDQLADPDGHRRDFTLPELVRAFLAVPELELIDARLVCERWSVGAAAERR